VPRRFINCREELLFEDEDDDEDEYEKPSRNSSTHWGSIREDLPVRTITVRKGREDHKD
jgi:hypothetical protein